MYPEVGAWLRLFLSDRFRRASIEVHDTHASPLNYYIGRNGLQGLFSSPIWHTYDIRVDLTAVVTAGDSTQLVFVECKLHAICLSDFSQLLGYSRVAQPLVSMVLSPAGIGNCLLNLIETYGRSDILEYHWQKRQTSAANPTSQVGRDSQGP